MNTKILCFAKAEFNDSSISSNLESKLTTEERGLN